MIFNLFFTVFFLIIPTIETFVCVFLEIFFIKFLLFVFAVNNNGFYLTHLLLGIM